MGSDFEPVKRSVLADIEAARVAPERAVKVPDGWQPWETVPRDGEPVLAIDTRVDDLFPQVVFFDGMWNLSDGVSYQEGFFTHWRRDCLSLTAAPVPALVPSTGAVKVRELRFVFDKFPCPEGPRFIEVEDEHGCSLSAGKWRQREDGLVELVVLSALVPDPAADEAWRESALASQRMIRAESQHVCPSADFCRKEIAALEARARVPDSAAGEVVAWAEQYSDKNVSVSLTQGRFHTVPLYASPRVVQKESPPFVIEDDLAAPAREALAHSGEADALKVAVEALERAQQFIRNGIELGFIRMPDASTPDPAHDTPGIIDEALATIRAQEG